MAKKVNFPIGLSCYLKSLSPAQKFRVHLPHDTPVVIGRMPELQISDTTCSRNQLELRANYDKRYGKLKLDLLG